MIPVYEWTLIWKVTLSNIPEMSSRAKSFEGVEERQLFVRIFLETDLDREFCQGWYHAKLLRNPAN
eukprot:753680-Hanusia_phi.AAC.9